jgi:Bacterial membrane protein YfhO
MFATVAFFLFRVGLAATGRGREALIRPAVAFGVALGLGTAMAAVMLVPLVEFLFQSGDYQRRLDRPTSHGEAKYLGALFLHDYWGRATQTTIAAFGSNRGYYAGGITLMLAACALVLRPTATRIALVLFALLSLDLALNVTPLADLVLQLPGFRTAHNGRMAIFLLFVLALLAGWGLDDLSGRELPPARLRRLALGAAAVIFCVPIVWMVAAGTIDLGETTAALKVAWAFRDPPAAVPGVPVAGTATAAIIRLSALMQWLVLAGAGLALIALRLGMVPRAGRLAIAAFVGLAVTVLAVDLFRANMGFNPAIPIDHATQPRTEAIAYLQSRRPNRFAGVGPAGSLQPLGPDLAMRYGLYDVRGYDYPVERRFDNFWRGAAAPDFEVIPPTTLAQPTEESLRALSLLSVADVLQNPADPPLDLPGLKLVTAAGGARVYSNANALPRVFLVERQHTVDGDAAALAAVRDGAVDTRRVAVTEQELPGLPQGGAGLRGAAGAARLVDYGRERALIRVDARRPSVLVLTDVYYPGWKASVDGRDTPVERVDYLLRGVVVPPGVHTVEFRYEPASWRAGWILSLLAALVTAGLALFGWRRRTPRTTRTDSVAA